MKKCSLIDLSCLNKNHIVADIEEIRRINPQRFEMEQLSAIIYANMEEQIFVGYQDVSPEAFWCRGHMPGKPLMPGVMICEAAAQVASYAAKKLGLLEHGLIGFGGLDNVKFREPVYPGQRLFIVDKVTKYRKNAILVLDFEAVVDENVVADGTIKGVLLPI
ncbi:MAG: 3-hydroxyacyl-ACP dehydratase FabZ family protein [Planctomycetia bacterium]|nr:3-hydroxyacyl-ACP dehydratase FabZ family protein [Planctomycetia bacterium]